MNDWPFQDYEILRQLPDDDYWQRWEVQDEINRILLVKKLKYFNELNNEQNRILRQQVEQNIFKLKEVQKEVELFPKVICSFSDIQSLYWVENYIEGKTLEQKAPLGIEAAINCVYPLTEALVSLHAVGLVHRNLQPDNIFLNNLAKPILINLDIVSDVLFSLDSASVKNFDSPFAAPELKSGNIGSSKSDLYSLAYILGFAIAGKLPDDSTKSQLTGEVDWEAYISNSNFLNYDRLINLLEKLGNEKPESRSRTSRQVLDELRTIKPVQEKIITTTGTQKIPTKSENKKSLSPKPEGSKNPAPAPAPAPTPAPVTVPTSAPTPPWKGVLISGLVALVAVLTTIILMQRSQLPEAFVNHSTSLSLKSNASKNQSPLPIGWIRLGAVSNTSGRASVGDQLISTSQPVTITPSVVPSIGDQATTITGVNLRRSFPQSPNYILAERVSILTPNQKIIILRLESFTDPFSSSPYTIIWAEIGLP